MSRRALIRPPRSYVVRVYRVMRSSVVGQVEDVAARTSRSFSSADELWSAIGGCRLARVRRVSSSLK